MNYWQVAAGSQGRDYSDLFLKYGIACVGGRTQQNTIQQVSVGDVIVLKAGQSTIRAAGRIADRNGKCCDCGDKDWLHDFDGWNLPAYCYIDWYKPETPVQVSGLTRATIERIAIKQIKDEADKILSTAKKLVPEPDPAATRKMEDSELLNHLLLNNLRPSAAEELVTALRRIRLLAKYYYDYCEWSDVREHETRTFLVAPLLLALGWSEQQTKIEHPDGSGGKVDVILYSGAFHSKDSKAVILIEAKGFSQGLSYAPEQAARYASNFPECRTVFVTNGFCYKAFCRSTDGAFNCELPSAYINLLDPRDRFPLDPKKVPGALRALELLLPGSRS